MKSNWVTGGQSLSLVLRKKPLPKVLPKKLEGLEPTNCPPKILEEEEKEVALKWIWKPTMKGPGLPPSSLAIYYCILLIFSNPYLYRENQGGDSQRQAAKEHGEDGVGQVIRFIGGVDWGDQDRLLGLKDRWMVGWARQAIGRKHWGSCPLARGKCWPSRVWFFVGIFFWVEGWIWTGRLITAEGLVLWVAHVAGFSAASQASDGVTSLLSSTNSSLCLFLMYCRLNLIFLSLLLYFLHPSWLPPSAQWPLLGDLTAISLSRLQHQPPSCFSGMWLDPSALSSTIFQCSSPTDD